MVPCERGAVLMTLPVIAPDDTTGSTGRTGATWGAGAIDGGLYGLYGVLLRATVRHSGWLISYLVPCSVMQLQEASRWWPLASLPARLDMQYSCG